MNEVHRHHLSFSLVMLRKSYEIQVGFFAFVGHRLLFSDWTFMGDVFGIVQTLRDLATIIQLISPPLHSPLVFFNQDLVNHDKVYCHALGKSPASVDEL